MKPTAKSLMAIESRNKFEKARKMGKLVSYRENIKDMDTFRFIDDKYRKGSKNKKSEKKVAQLKPDNMVINN